ncbi:hypothetical protein SAMN04490239_3551 [Rhodococcus koreensis]|uniref:Uncharacterized protein n=1 Tax=Rhodococcus koreensis TaxID=99653 RepID=A0A1H4RAY9_9NOCA|nr:hypothetical protein SAMN04490239_3551 [Rhodococcus koreensis]
MTSASADVPSWVSCELHWLCTVIGTRGESAGERG